MYTVKADDVIIVQARYHDEQQATAGHHQVAGSRRFSFQSCSDPWLQQPS